VYGPSVGRIGTGICLSSSSRIVFSFRMKWQMRQEGHKQEGQLIEMWHANSYFFYYTLFSFTDKSHNSLLRELLVGSLNEAHISPESSYVQTLQTCALKRVRSLSAEVGHYMEEEVLKLDITWKKKKKSSE